MDDCFQVSTEPVDPLRGLRDFAGSEYADLIDELSDADRQWLAKQLAEGSRPKLLFEAVHLRWRRQFEGSKATPVENPSLAWWTACVSSAPVAFGLAKAAEPMTEAEVERRAMRAALEAKTPRR